MPDIIDTLRASMAGGAPPPVPKKSADQLMWEFLTGGNKGNQVSVQRDQQLGTPPKNLMTQMQMLELARAGLLTANRMGAQTRQAAPPPPPSPLPPQRGLFDTFRGS